METLKEILELFALLLPAVLSMCAPVLVLIAVKWVCRHTAKLDVETRQVIEEQVIHIVLQATAYAEQEAYNFATRTKQRMQGEHKLNLAIMYVTSCLERAGIQDLDETDITSKIEAYLGLGVIRNNQEGQDGVHVFEE